MRDRSRVLPRRRGDVSAGRADVRRGARARRSRCAARAGPATSPASRPSSPSCSTSRSRTSRCSARRTTSSSRSSAAWCATSISAIEIVGVPIVREPDGLALSLAQRVPVGRAAHAPRWRCRAGSPPPRRCVAAGERDAAALRRRRPRADRGRAARPDRLRRAARRRRADPIDDGRAARRARDRRVRRHDAPDRQPRARASVTHPRSTTSFVAAVIRICTPFDASPWW